METPTRSPLLPDRHPIQDFFICDVADAIPKDDMGSMEHPIFSLATKPDTSLREYEHNGVSISILPSALAFLTRRPSVLAIPKASRVAHVDDNAAAGDLELTGAEVAAIDAAFPAGRPRPLPMI